MIQRIAALGLRRIDGGGSSDGDMSEPIAEPLSMKDEAVETGEPAHNDGLAMRQRPFRVEAACQGRAAAAWSVVTAII